MYKMCYKVQFITSEGDLYRLDVVSEIEIMKSVDNLSDTCSITLPGYVFNNAIQLTEVIKRGVKVRVWLGYDDNLVEEFRGYVREVLTNNGALTIACEDALFLFRKNVKNVQLLKTSVKQIAERLCNEIDSEYKVICDYDVTYEKFTINDATAYDVLKKLQDDTAANVWFDTINKTLHIHPAYSEKLGDVVYSAHQNIESSSLEYQAAEDKKVEVIVETTDAKGKTKQVSAGTTGGERITLKIGSVDGKDIAKIAQSKLRQHLFDGYKGSFTGWLLPYVAPAYSAKIIDQEYPYKTGVYYVVSVKTTFSASGGVRTIQPGIKLS